MQAIISGSVARIYLARVWLPSSSHAAGANEVVREVGLGALRQSMVEVGACKGEVFPLNIHCLSGLSSGEPVATFCAF